MQLWLVTLFLSRKKFHAKQIFVLSSSMKLGPDQGESIRYVLYDSQSKQALDDKNHAGKQTHVHQKTNGEQTSNQIKRALVISRFSRKYIMRKPQNQSGLDLVSSR